jgi:glycerol-3-phosphate acyltransferase PlsY
MEVFIWIGCAVASYLLGSIPTGYVWGRARGIDIRTIGSGNIGATNTMRALGKPAGITTLILDAAKGFLPVFFAPRFFPDVNGVALQILCTVCVVAGHNWTCWLKFKGGKGVATSAGALLGCLPGPAGIVLLVWVVVFALSRYVSLASIAGAVVLPLATWWLTTGVTWLVFASVLSVLVIVKHRANIQRLLNGTENRVGAKLK